MCAGIRDAANLAWKLSAVLSGAPDELLDTYQSERKENARAFIAKSVELGRLINQTAHSKITTGKMASIWPSLGPGLGARVDLGGELAPQPFFKDRRADNLAMGGFYGLGDGHPDALPQFRSDWPNEHGYIGAIARPDGYALGAYRSNKERSALTQIAIANAPAPYID